MRLYLQIEGTTPETKTKNQNEKMKKTTQATKENNSKFESMFVDFINNNSEKVKAISAIMAMSEKQKADLIKEFKASL